LRHVYLDNNATTPAAPEVVEAMLPFFNELYGNPSSAHRLGTKSAVKIREARKTVAGFLGCDEEEIVFTGCGSESDNLAILGTLQSQPRKKHIVTTSVEHPAVLGVFDKLTRKGYDATILGVDESGQINLDELRECLREDTVLVSVMFANNETGVIFPMNDVAGIVKGAFNGDVTLHVDAVQAIGKIPLDLSKIAFDLVAVSGHKFHAPKGIGVLFHRRGLECEPVFQGGSQERGRRPGTENVPGIVGIARACELAGQKMDYYNTEVRRLRDRFEDGVLGAVPDTAVHGAGCDRLPNTSNICFKGIDGRSMLILLDEVGISASAGSACKSGAGVPSPVLAAMGVSLEDAVGSVRFSLSYSTTEEDVDYALEQIPPIVKRMRS
jgi:cysteine desulfurase